MRATASETMYGRKSKSKRSGGMQVCRKNRRNTNSVNLEYITCMKSRPPTVDTLTSKFEFHDINYEVPFDMSNWFSERYKGKRMDAPIRPADKWVLVRPDRFPSLHTITGDNAKSEDVAAGNLPETSGLLSHPSSNDLLARLPVEVKLLIFQFVMQPEEESDKGDTALICLQGANRFWSSFFNSREAPIQSHYKTRCAAMGLIPTTSDTRRRAKAFRAVLTQNVDNAQSDWSRYYKDCKHSRSMRNRHRTFKIVKKIFRIIHLEEFRTKKTHPDHLRLLIARSCFLGLEPTRSPPMSRVVILQANYCQSSITWQPYCRKS
ncbi:hypothetical protein DFS34DRAFT_417042 [Phlyctochytrium arcticum]|nr:hypothetical protein DFS34DRAFT_417042 [Phlyctochytrium arcticum]